MPASESASKFALPKSLAPENLFGVARVVRPTTELGAPEVAHVVETLVDCSESRVEKRHYDASQRRVKQHRDADGKIELLVGHQS
jgi:hypothetical protein